MTVLEALNVQRAHKLRVEDFFLLSESGALDDCGKTELIEGEIIVMNAQHRPHLRVKMGLYNELHDAFATADPGSTVFVEGTIEMAPHNAPEPDILVTTEAEGDGAVPVASVRLVIEVADTTLANDLRNKSQLYARYGIPEYWVADVNGRTLHQLWEPSEAGYARSRQTPFGDDVAAETVSGVRISTAALS